jgi:5-methylcytosine-specific restriction protein A
MPNRLKRPCAEPGCPAIGTQSRCAVHHREERQRYASRRAPQQRLGPGWYRLRYAVLQRDPICVICRTVPSSEADHKIPRRQGGLDTLENLQGACKPCHSRKTASRDGGWGNPKRSDLVVARRRLAVPRR